MSEPRTTIDCVKFDNRLRARRVLGISMDPGYERVNTVGDAVGAQVSASMADLNIASSGFVKAERMFSATFSINLVPQKGSFTS
jgi:hypothetical protein